MKVIEADLFDTDLPALGHGVNLQGVMGAGIAVGFRERFPEMMPAYREWCQYAEPGQALVYRVKDGRYVANIASQRLPGRDARYEWLTTGLATAATDLMYSGVRDLALPWIGCGIGGLDQSAVRVILTLLERIAGRSNFQFTIYQPTGGNQ